MTGKELTSSDAKVSPLATSPKDFSVPTTPIPFGEFSALVQRHTELADSFIHYIEFPEEPSSTSSYLEIYLFLPRQPPPYFIRFHLPHFNTSTLDNESASLVKNHLEDCTVSFTAHTTPSMPSSDGMTRLKFKMQPTLLFLLHTLMIVGENIKTGTTPLQSDIFLKVTLGVFRELDSQSMSTDGREWELSLRIVDYLRQELKGK